MSSKTPRVRPTDVVASARQQQQQQEATPHKSPSPSARTGAGGVSGSGSSGSFASPGGAGVRLYDRAPETQAIIKRGSISPASSGRMNPTAYMNFLRSSSGSNINAASPGGASGAFASPNVRPAQHGHPWNPTAVAGVEETLWRPKPVAPNELSSLSSGSGKAQMASSGRMDANAYMRFLRSDNDAVAPSNKSPARSRSKPLQSARHAGAFRIGGSGAAELLQRELPPVVDLNKKSKWNKDAQPRYLQPRKEPPWAELARQKLAEEEAAAADAEAERNSKKNKKKKKGKQQKQQQQQFTPSPPSKPKQQQPPESEETPPPPPPPRPASSTSSSAEHLATAEKIATAAEFEDDAGTLGDAVAHKKQSSDMDTVEVNVLIAEEEIERRSVDDEQSGAFAGVRMLAKVAAQPAPASTEDADDGDGDNDDVIADETPADAPAEEETPAADAEPPSDTSEVNLLVSEEEIERRSVDDEQSGAFAGVRMLAKVAAQPAPASTEDADDGDAAVEATAAEATAAEATAPAAVASIHKEGTLMANFATSDLSTTREYLAVAGDAKVTPVEIRLLLSKLLPGEVANHWYGVVGGRRRAMLKPPPRPEPIIHDWVRGGGTAAEHAALMNKRRVRGVVVHTDSSGLSKLSQRRPLLEVLRLIHEPKELIARYGFAAGGIALPFNWVADNTGIFFPMPAAADAKPKAGETDELSELEEEGDDDNDNDAAADAAAKKAAAKTSRAERDFLETVIRTMMVVQHEIGRTCQVQVGMGLHFGTFFHIGDTLQGHEAEHVEHLAEDFCAAHEIAMTEETARAFFFNNDDGDDDDDDGTEQQQSSAPSSCGFFSVTKRDADEMNGYRVDFNSALFTSSSASDSEEAKAQQLDVFFQMKVLPERVAAAVKPTAAYPASYSEDFQAFIAQHEANRIVQYESEVASMVESGVFLLAKVRGVQHERLLDQIAQRMFVREEFQIATQRTRRAFEESSDDSDGNATPAVRLIKCNGDIAIALASSVAAAATFSFLAMQRFRDLGSFGCSIGAWRGDAFVFDLTSAAVAVALEEGQERFFDITGAPVNLASKLAEDFGEDGVFFGNNVLGEQQQPEKDDPLVICEGGGDLEIVLGAAAAAADADAEAKAKAKAPRVQGRVTKLEATPVRIEQSGVTIEAVKLNVA